jgi:hydrogenase small subunit
MNTTRRDFLRYCGMSAATLGLTATDLFRLGEVLANPNGPSVLWLQGSACTGCSVSLLNRVSSQAPVTAGDLLINSINLEYHPNLMTASGLSAVEALDAAYARGGYVLAVEGGVPTAFGGAAGWAMTDASGHELTIAEAVQKYGARAGAIICMGTCASWGGIPASGSNPAGIRSVGSFLGKPTINVGGCPPHPDWMVWPIVQLILNKPIAKDSFGRPTGVFRTKVHERCPLKERDEAKYWGQPQRCLKSLGCRGPEAVAPCPTQRWNNGVSFCAEAGAPCLNCTSATFPGRNAFHKFPG